MTALDAHDLTLPKPAELFMSDIHGEYESFAHVCRSGCGVLRRAIDEVFADTLSDDAKRLLLNQVCYPTELLASATNEVRALAQTQVSALYEHLAVTRTKAYLTQIEADANAPLEQLCRTVQFLTVGTVHVVGDIYDRGPSPELIVDELMGLPQADIQWGNHDIVWMGASLGQPGCVCTAVRICARYGNLPILTNGYGLDLTPLADFALKAYADDPCAAFGLRDESGLTPEEKIRNIKMQKAMAIIQFKVEGHLIDENPSYGLDDRKLLHHIDYEQGTITIDGVELPMTDTVYPTIDPEHPYDLTDEEQAVLDNLQQQFLNCEKLQRHIHFFLTNGGLYTISNDHLLFHACVPLNADGTLKEVNIFGTPMKGRELFDAVDAHVRDAFFSDDPVARKTGADLLWYLWLGPGSPLFGKTKMATLERYVVTDKTARAEIKNPFFSLLENEEAMNNIIADFGISTETGRVVCGHVPVKVKKGEDPVKCGGKCIVVDGGFSEAYQPETGIAGFTLIADAQGESIATHQAFKRYMALQDNLDIQTSFRTIQAAAQPVTMADTDEAR